jgi:hypothetical protein
MQLKQESLHSHIGGEREVQVRPREIQVLQLFCTGAERCRSELSRKMDMHAETEGGFQSAILHRAQL